MATAEFALLDAGILFVVAALGGLVARRLDQSVIPFYILVGMLTSPYVLGRLPAVFEDGLVVGGGSVLGVTVPELPLVPAVGTPAVAGTDPVAQLAGFAIDGEAAFVALGAEIGIVFLLFFLGLEFNLERLLASRDRIGKAGVVDLTINFGVGLVLGYALFGAALPAFLVAGIVYISSSAIITKSLIDLGWIANDEADPMLGTLVFEDLVIAVYLVVASVLVLGGGDLGAALGDLAAAIGFIVVLLALVQYGTAFFQRSLEVDSHEHTVLRAVGITVFVAGVALELGVSEAVAAFFVGMAFSSTEHTHDLERLLEPVRDVFAAVFFVWIGLVTNPALFVDAFVVGAIAAAVVLTTPTKFVSGYLGGRIYGLDERRSIRVGLGMVTRGEFSLIIASIAIAGAGAGLASGVASDVNAIAVGYVLVMSVLGTTLMGASDRIESVVLSRLSTDRSDARPTDH